MKQVYLNCVAKYLHKNGVTVDFDKTRRVSYIAKLISGITGKKLSKHMNAQKYRNFVLGFIKEKNISLDVSIKTKESVRYNEKIPPDYSFIKKKFYASPEWRSLRYEVLKEQGARCCLCGRTAKDGVVLHVDHIIPLSKDWSRRLDKDNLQVLCEDCNLGKSNKDCIDWR